MDPFHPRDTTSHYRLTAGSLQQRLCTLLPNWREQSFSIQTHELKSNASFVNYVHHHRLRDLNTGQTLELVEKSIRKVAFIRSQEARFHREQAVFDHCVHFRHPACLGIIETPWESFIFSQFVHGQPPNMHRICQALALGIAEQEHVSHQYLLKQPRRKALLFWSMDFFRPWFLLRPRFRFMRNLPALERLGREEPSVAGLAGKFKQLAPVLTRLKQAARRSPRCISHLDYLRKNLLLDNGHLQLLDWSEVKIGRVGFDGGAYLASLFRRNDLPVFMATRQAFITHYCAALPGDLSQTEARRNLDYVFLLNALFHCLRPETLTTYRQSNRMSALRQKYDYLLDLLHEYHYSQLTD